MKRVLLSALCISALAIASSHEQNIAQGKVGEIALIFNNQTNTSYTLAAEGSQTPLPAMQTTRIDQPQLVAPSRQGTSARRALFIKDAQHRIIAIINTQQEIMGKSEAQLQVTLQAQNRVLHSDKVSSDLASGAVNYTITFTLKGDNLANSTFTITKAFKNKLTLEPAQPSQEGPFKKQAENKKAHQIKRLSTKNHKITKTLKVI